MKRASTYTLRNSYSSIKLIGFILLISFFLLKPVIQTILHFSNEEIELCENNEEENTEETEIEDDLIKELNNISKLSLDYLEKNFRENPFTFHTNKHLSNFIIEVTSPPPEIT